MWKYRYRREVIPDAEWEARCNALGEEGWSLVGAPRWWDDKRRAEDPGWLCFFKRTVSNREQLQRVFALSPQPEREEPTR